MCIDAQLTKHQQFTHLTLFGDKWLTNNIHIPILCGMILTVNRLTLLLFTLTGFSRHRTLVNNSEGL